MDKNKQLETIDAKVSTVIDARTIALARIYNAKTPKDVIKMRPGPAGMQFPYVEIGYVISQLNLAFNHLWDFKIISEVVGDKQIYVKGSLTVWLSDTMSLTKENFGGADIKMFKGTSNAVDIANDLKAASSDCLKKCASLFGVAADVMYKDMDKYTNLPNVIDGEEDKRQNTLGHLFGIAAKNGFGEADIKKVAYTVYKVESLTKLSTEQLQELIFRIEKAGPKKVQVAQEESTANSSVAEAIVQKDHDFSKVEAIFDRNPEDCGNPDCKRGPGGTIAKHQVDSPWCSEDCKLEYYPNDRPKGKRAWEK